MYLEKISKDIADIRNPAGVMEKEKKHIFAQQLDKTTL